MQLSFAARMTLPRLKEPVKTDMEWTAEDQQHRSSRKQCSTCDSLQVRVHTSLLWLSVKEKIHWLNLGLCAEAATNARSGYTTLSKAEKDVNGTHPTSKLSKLSKL